MKEGTGRLATTFRAHLEKVPFLKIVSWKKEARLGEFTPDIVIKLSLPAGEQVIIVETKNSGELPPRLRADLHRTVRLSQPDRLRAAWASANSFDKHHA